MTPWDWRETVGNMAIYGFGDKFLPTLIPAYLDRINLDDCLDYVQNDKDLLAKVPEKYWAKLRTMAKIQKFNITVEEIVLHLQKNRPDVLSVIINHPNGRIWLAKQVESCRQKLGLPCK